MEPPAKFLTARLDASRWPGVHRGEAGLSNRPRDGDPQKDL